MNIKPSKDDRELADRILATLHNSNEMDHVAAAKVIAEWNTRPQPAPPEGEPDFEIYANHLAYEGPRIPNSGGKADTDWIFQRALEEFERVYRFGLAARPAGGPDEATIERVAEAIAMAGTSHFGDDTPYAQQNHLVKMMRRYEAKAAIEAYGLAARPKVEDADEWLKSTELYRQWRDMKAKLAEREAELAEADAVIDYQLGTSDSIAYPEHHNDHILEAKERHAARQQQKDAR